MPSTGVGAVELVLLNTRYPLGAGDATVKEPLTEVVVSPDNTKLVGWAVGVEHGLGDSSSLKSSNPMYQGVEFALILIPK